MLDPQERKLVILFLLPTSLFMLLLLWLPFIQGIWMSFHMWPFMGEPQWRGLENYAKFLQADYFWDSIKATAIYCLSTFFQLLVALAAALAGGCRPVCTALPGVRSGILPHLPGVLHTLELPEMEKIDQPAAAALPDFAEDLSATLERALEAPLPHSEKDPGELLAPFTWRAVFKRIEAAWLSLAG